MPQGDRTQANRVRRLAERQGMMARKSRRRDPQAWDYGKWYLVDPDTNLLLFHFDNADDLERWLLTDPETE